MNKIKIHQIRVFLLLALFIIFVLFNIDLQLSISQVESGLEPNKDEPVKDLQRVFIERHRHLQERCRQLNITTQFRPKAWLTFLTTEAPGPLKVCVPPKAGSSSWSELNTKLQLQKLSQSHPANAVLVRHPLTRLISAYRDKYLDGAPIHAYNDEWRNRTNSPSTWDYNWYDYWLPTLISLGHLKPTNEFFDILHQCLEVFDFIGENFSYDGKELVITKENDFDELSKFIATQMLITGKQMGLQHAVINAYSDINENLKARFGNYSFTFQDFLEFVVWSNDIGILDIHWTPYTQLCFPCHQNYKYVLHLESINAESRLLLSDVGYKEDVKLTTKHKTKGLTNNFQKDDFMYYENIPKNLMSKILDIFEHDFDLFGYNKNIFIN